MRLVIKSITDLGMPSPIAPTRPSAMSTGSTCMNTAKRQQRQHRILGLGRLFRRSVLTHVSRRARSSLSLSLHTRRTVSHL